MQAKECLCFQFADILDVDAADPDNLIFIGTSDINNGGALTLPNADGECDNRVYHIDVDGRYAGEEGFLCDGTPDVGHLNVPVLNA